MEIKEMIELMEAFSQNDLYSFTLKEGNLNLQLTKGLLHGSDIFSVQGTGSAADGETARAVSEADGGVSGAVSAAAPASLKRAVLPAADKKCEARAGETSQPAETAGSTAGSTAGQAEVPPLAVPGSSGDTFAAERTVCSPLVGIFYAAASPGAEPFVRVGERVRKGQVIGIVEAMKLMNEIESEHDGEVTEILVNNEDVVEYGQVLLRLKP